MKWLRDHWVYLSLAGVLLVVVAVSAVIYVKSREPDYAIASDTYLEEAKKADMPTDKAGKISYYSRIGARAYEAGDYKEALENYLLADGLITDRSLTTGQTVNVGIALSYKMLGKKEEAREYYQREINRLQNTDNEEVIQHLKEQKDKI
jgi:tetratricopeptide (TPR) repeat protein